MRVKPVSFQVELAAGRTVVDRDEHVIDRPQGMDGWILNYTAEGVGRINHGGRRFTTGVGQFLLFKPLAPHDYGYEARSRHWVHLWVYFFPRAPWYDWLTWSEASPGILRLDLAGHELLPRAVGLFEELVAVARSHQPRRTALAMSLLEQLLLWLDASSPASGHARLDPRVQRVVEHCHARFAERLTVPALARLAGLSPSRFTHLFSAQLGTSPVAYLEQVRIHAAREQLMLTGRPVAEVAAAVGYGDPVWFARCFRRRVGLSPRAFRQRGR
jgi:AraC family transcriptional regulator of arabinose operon